MRCSAQFEMLQHDVKQTLKEEINRFKDKSLRGDYGEEARRSFAEMKLDGAIKAFTELEFCCSPIIDLAGCCEPFRNIYGLDGGSTRPIHFADGTTICANQAVMTAEPPVKLNGLPLEAFRTISIVSHSHRNIGGPYANYRSDDLVNLWRIHITKDYLKSEVDHIVKGIADSASEGRHMLRMLEELDLRDSLVFLDGNVFPIGLYYYLVSEESWNWDIDIGSWDELVKILEQHLKIAEALAEREIPYVGINKNPGTRYLLSFCLEAAERNWGSDRQFIGALFNGIPKGSLGYTNWFVQERYRPYLSRKASVPEGFDIFAELACFELKLNPEDYHVCSFFVYDPRTVGGRGSIFKIETPRAVLAAHDPKELRLAILSEIAKGKGVPNVIRKADSRARITQEEREGLIRSSGLPLDTFYDQGRGEPL